MKKVKLILTMVLAAGMVAVFLESCKKSDSPPSPLKLVSLKTGDGTALDGATSTTGIATNATVVATFDKEIDVTTATSSNIAIKLGGVAVAGTVTAVGAAITIAPSAVLATGTNYTVSIAPTLKAKDGGPATSTEFTFKTFGRANVVPPQSASQLSYFPFTGNMNDEVGTHTPVAADVKNLTFVEDRFGFAGLAGDFNGTTTIVEIPNGEQYMANKDFSISFWIKANSTKESHFVLGLGAWKGFQFEIAGGPWTAVNKGVKLATQYDLGLVGNPPVQSTDAEDTWYNGEANGWQGSTFAKVLPNSTSIYFKDKWAHVVWIYNSGAKVGSMYINGDKTRSWDFNLWPSGEAKKGALGVKFAGNLTGGGNKLALGFIQGSLNRIITDTWADYADPLNNHFKGVMDDVRIFKVALTASEVTTLYTAEKP